MYEEALTQFCRHAANVPLHFMLRAGVCLSITLQGQHSFGGAWSSQVMQKHSWLRQHM